MKRDEKDFFALIERIRERRENGADDLTPEQEESRIQSIEFQQAKELAEEIFSRHRDSIITKTFNTMGDLMEMDNFPPYTFIYYFNEYTTELTRRFLKDRIVMGAVSIMHGIKDYRVNVQLKDRTEEFHDDKNHLEVQITIMF